ncbi:MAG: DUF3108 domain-containing protein [Acetobacteraceae bacterium]
MRVSIRLLLALLLGAAAPSAARAEPSAATTTAAEVAVHASYRVYAVGMHVADLTAGVALGPASYRLTVDYKTTGMLGFFSSGHQTSNVDGIWTANLPLPREYRSTGVWRGEDRVTLIDYEAGRPVIRRLLPSPQDEYEPVPAALQAASTDALSAMAELLRRIAQTDRCDAHGIVFDGRRASQITARTAGNEVVPATDRSSFAGPALRCDFTGIVVAGFRRDASPDSRRRPLTGSAWFARPVASGPPLPVMLRFETRWFGSALMYLAAAAPDAPVLAAADPATVNPPATSAPRSRPSR